MIPARAGLPLAAYVCIALAVLTFRPMQTPGPFLRDFEAYWSAGAAWNAHADPYGRAVWHAERTVPGVRAERDELLPFVGPPQTIVVWSAFARLNYVAAARIWFVLLLLAAAGLLVACVAGAAARPDATGVASFIALTLAFGPLSSDLALGQVALVAFSGAVLTALPQRRSRAPGAVAAAMVALAQPNVAVGIVSQLQRVRTALAVALAVLVTYAAGAIAAGWRWPLTYAAGLAAHAQSERGSAIQFTPAAVAHGFGASGSAAVAIAAAFAIAAVCAAIAAFLRAGNPFARFAAISVLAPFVATFFHEHDLLVAYAAVVWCGVHARSRLRVVALVGTLLVATDWLGMAQRPTGVVQTALLAIAVACAFIACRRASVSRGEPTPLGATSFSASLRGSPHSNRGTSGEQNGASRRAERRAEGAQPKDAFIGACAAMAIVFGAAAWVATTHPVPVWPDTLGAFHASGAASAASVWAQEQRRSGLFAINGAWAALRTLSLLGCAILCWCVVKASPAAG